MFPIERKEFMMLFFDMPVETGTQQRAYRQFRKYLKSNGYMPLQKSVYLRIFHNGRNINEEYDRVRKAFPKEGTVSLLPLGTSVFERMQTVGECRLNIQAMTDDLVFI